MKSQLRKEFKAMREKFTGEPRSAADRAILNEFMHTYGSNNSFFIYNSIGAEADTSALISSLLKQGKSVLLPRVEGKDMVAAPYGKLKAGFGGIPEPVTQAFRGYAAVKVIPLLAINPRGYRLGYGGGFYDRYLSGAQTIKVGLGYSFQITEKFEEDAWDQPLDAFVCEKGIITFEKSLKGGIN